MSLTRLLAALVLATAFCGCRSLKDDPLVGDHPWQPGSGARPGGMLAEKSR